MQIIKIIQTRITKLQHYANENLLTLIHKQQDHGF